MSINKRKEIMWRMWLAILFPVLAGCAVVFQTFKIQVIEGAEWRDMADSLTVVSRTIERKEEIYTLKMVVCFLPLCRFLRCV
ncbi:MAG: hypothetical protein R2777_08465 [Chitinophagales bacterium]